MAEKIFISYRRDDSRYQARMIHAAFCKVIPSDHVFMDVNSIAPGANFRKILKDWVDQCEVLLALIGPGWIDARDVKTKMRRLDNKSDFVRIEIGEALKRGIPVVPVILDDAPMPDAELLPDDLKELADRQAEFVEYRTFDADVERLIRKLKLSEGVGRTGSPEQPTSAPVEIPVPIASGLARIPLHHETIVLFSTTSSGSSLDKGKNPPFTAAIVSALQMGITDIEVIANKFIAVIGTLPANMQSTVYETNLTRSINLADKQFDKLALIVGNSTYANLPKLVDAARDDEILARELAHFDFETIVSFDAGKQQLLRSIARYVDRLKSARENTIAIFYFRGYALQINDTNFILPTDAAMSTQAGDYVPLQEAIDALREAKISASIILVDSSHDPSVWMHGK
jgi:hypothetical protein